MTNFSVYEHRMAGNRARPGITVTVTGRGCLAFSVDAWTVLGSPRYVKFLVDTSGHDRVIGFQGCETYEPEAHPVNGTRTVTAAALLRFLGYDTSGPARRYTLRIVEGLPPHINLDEELS